MKTDNEKLDCHSTKKARRAHQQTHKPDFGVKDLWSYVVMNEAGTFVYGFDDEAEAKEYAKYQKKHRRPCTIVPIDEAINMPLPPTWEHNWDYDNKWEIPKELEAVFGGSVAPILATDNSVTIR